MKRILWFRRDLRIEDNKLLSLDGEVLPIFIFDINILNMLPQRDRRVSFIFNTVKNLKTNLQNIGLNLAVFYGNPVNIIQYLQTLYDFDEVVASKDYDEYALKRDMKVSFEIDFNLLNDNYIFDKDEVLKDNGEPYLVFTPFYKKSKEIFSQSHFHNHTKTKQQLLNFEYERLIIIKENKIYKVDLEIENIGFQEVILDNFILQSPKIKLEIFSQKLDDYVINRDFIYLDGTSFLSLDLRFGIIGIRQILRWLVEQKKLSKQTEPFFRQLIFRDFYAYLLAHFPYIEHKNYKYSFYGIENDKRYEAFCAAKTGVPIVDAGVRELLSTGFMNNRVRMVVASFFTKDLLLPWKWGERFFAKHLLDYDAASNVLSWQWSASTGIDPQPYFRVFNPYTQSLKFDKDAIYIKKYVQELRDIPSKNIHNEKYLLNIDIKDYPKPIVKHKEAAKLAIDMFRNQIPTIS